MQHLFQQGIDPNAPTLVLFHGTGGSERDLLPLAHRVSPVSSILSIKGNSLENGMPRYFQRLADGVFNEQDLVVRTKEIYDFIAEAAIQYGFDRNNTVAIGYSHGANIACSLLFHYADALKGAILHHPMIPRSGIALPDLSRTSVFIGAGVDDPMIAPDVSEQLQELLTQAGSHVVIHWERYGHQLSGTEVDAAIEWFQDIFMS